MIYFDNSVTTYPKPKEVTEYLPYITENFVSPNRSQTDLSINSSRQLLKSRIDIGNFFGVSNPLNIAFTLNCTHSLNLVISSLFNTNDHVITTEFDHNALLRPLYTHNIDFDFVPIKDNFLPDYTKLHELIKPNTRAIICSHSSNILGTVVDVKLLSTFAKKHNLLLILDVAQSGGIIPIDLEKENIDIICFTGHKYLYGVTGVGGICVNPNSKINFKNTLTGGSGSNSLSISHSVEMPDVFEAGTHNFLSIFALQRGIEFINKIGIDNIYEKESSLINYLYSSIKDIKNINIYGNFNEKRSPILSFNIEGADSTKVSNFLWEKKKIATRCGFHCVPFLHKRLNTTDTGIVRISPSYFNTMEEVEILIESLNSFKN